MKSSNSFNPNRVLNLSQLCELIIDCPHETPEWLPNGIFVVRNYNIIDGRIIEKGASYVDEQTYQKRIRRAIPLPGDLIISREAPMGTVGIIPEGMRCCLGQRVVLLRANPEICDNRYLLYALQSPFVQAQINQVNKTGSIVSNLGISTLKELRIPYMSLSAQKKISNALGLLDLKIIQNELIDENLSQLSKTVFDYWFTQFDFPDENGKPYRSSGGKMKWDDQIEVYIPQGWNTCKLRECVSVSRGISYAGSDIVSRNGKPLISLASIDKNRNYRPDQLKFYSGTYSDDSIAHPFDLLLACTDMTQQADIIGSPIVVPETSNEFIFTMDLAKITSTQQALDNSYLYMTLRTEWYHNYIKWFASGTNVKHLDISGILDYWIVLPPETLQKKFKEVLLSGVKIINACLSENEHLRNFRDWLLPMFINGQATLGD